MTLIASSWPAAAALLLNAAIFGLSWWPFRYLDQLGLHSLWTTAFMYAIASSALLAWRPKAIFLLIDNRNLWLLLLAAGLTNAAFNWGVLIGEVIRVVLLFYLMPVWAAMLARLILGEPISAFVVLRIALAVCGAGLVLWKPGFGLPLPASLGDWLGLAGGFFFALTNITLKRQANTPTEARALAMFMGGLVVPGMLALSLAGPLVPLPVLPVWPWFWPAAALAMVFIVANLCLQYGAARLPANVTAIIMISEVAFAAASAIIFGNETANWATAVGAAMIVTAALAASLSARTGPSAAKG